jgi:hypothetical protein
MIERIAPSLIHWPGFIVLRLGYKTSIVLSIHPAVLRISPVNNHER